MPSKSFILTIPQHMLYHLCLYWHFKLAKKGGAKNTNLSNKFIFLVNGLKALSPYFHASLTQRLLRITKKQSEDSLLPSINLRNFCQEFDNANTKLHHTHTHKTQTLSNIWVNYNKNHINLKLVTSFWRILFNDLFGYRMFAWNSSTNIQLLTFTRPSYSCGACKRNSKRCISGW